MNRTRQKAVSICSIRQHTGVVHNENALHVAQVPPHSKPDIKAPCLCKSAEPFHVWCLYLDTWKATRSFPFKALISPALDMVHSCCEIEYGLQKWNNLSSQANFLPHTWPQFVTRLNLLFYGMENITFIVPRGRKSILVEGPQKHPKFSPVVSTSFWPESESLSKQFSKLSILRKPRFLENSQDQGWDPAWRCRMASLIRFDLQQDEIPSSLALWSKPPPLPWKCFIFKHFAENCDF